MNRSLVSACSSKPHCGTCSSPFFFFEAEGFRLEGFDGQNQVLKSMDPLLDFGGPSAGIENFGCGTRGKLVVELCRHISAEHRGNCVHDFEQSWPVIFLSCLPCLPQYHLI